MRSALKMDLRHRFIVACSVAFALVSVALVAPPTYAGASSRTNAFYLDVGASASVGVQPTVNSPNGRPTDRGYANDLVALEAAQGTKLDLTKIGCPGETTTTLIYGGDHCYARPTTQMGLALLFLQTHRNEPGLVTLDLGFNDLLTCVTGMVVDESCVRTKLRTLSLQLPVALMALKAAAGPQVHFIGLNHFNPYLASTLLGPRGERFAEGSIAMIRQLNVTLQHVYGSFDVPVANVSGAFGARKHSHARMRHGDSVSAKVTRICELSWMCRLDSYGPNYHPNDAGYFSIAEAIFAKAPAIW